MFKSSKQPKRPKGGGEDLMRQMGFQMPNFDGPNIGEGDDDDDDDLEAELRKIQNETGASKRMKDDNKKKAEKVPNLQAFHNDVNKLLNDIEKPINDDELSEDDEDELLAELHEIAGDIEIKQETKQLEVKLPQVQSNSNVVSVLHERREMYMKAVQTAKATNDAAKTRRLERQFKVIQEMLQSANTGMPINEDEIPPALSVTASSSQPSVVSKELPVREQSPPPSAKSVEESGPSTPVIPSASIPSRLSTKSDDPIEKLKSLALQAKTAGDINKAKEYLIQIKKLQSQASTAPQVPEPTSAPNITSNNLPENTVPSESVMPLKVPEPRSILEALQQRHEELKKRHQDALNAGDSSKARRLDRLSKQHLEAIDATRKGQAYDYSELPELPGFAPIPVPQPSTKPVPQPSSLSGTTLVSTTNMNPPQKTIPVQSSQQNRATPSPTVTRASEQKSLTIDPQDLRFKQEQYQKLALQAKRNGDIETAKKYLLAYKQIEQTLKSTASDLPTNNEPVQDSVDLNNDAIRDDDYTAEILKLDRDTIFRRLQEDLLGQMQLCARNQQMYARMEGLVNTKHAQEFKNLEQRCAHDLEKLKLSLKNNLKAPTFHYEKRQMNIIQVNNDLTENELEVNIIRGINLQVPAGYPPETFSSYVVIEVPYPTETPQTARTHPGIGATNAEYTDAVHKFQIKRSDTKFKRSLNRKEIKLAIFYRAGYFRADRQLGIASVKLASLEQSATVHESVDIYETDHKKKPGGKLEVKIRIKEAFGQSKLSEISTERWLVIDRFEDIHNKSKPSTITSPKPTTTTSINAISHLVSISDVIGSLAVNLVRNEIDKNNVDYESSTNVSASSNNDNSRMSQSLIRPQSIQVLKYEAELLGDQIQALEDDLSPDQIDKLKIKQKMLYEQSEQIVENLRQGGKNAVLDHVRDLEQLLQQYEQEANDYLQRNETKKADIFSHKKNLVAKEIETLAGNTTSSNAT